MTVLRPAAANTLLANDYRHGVVMGSPVRSDAQAVALAGPPPDPFRPTDLGGFFTPRHVALVGASESSGWTGLVLDGVDRSPGLESVSLINPRHRTVHGRPAVTHPAQLTQVPDLAFLMVGGDRVPELVYELIELGTRDFVALSAGLDSVRERGLGELCRQHGARLLGPNVSGFVNLTAGVRLFGLPTPKDVPAGRIGVVLQSGGLATHVLGLARAWGAGLSTLVTTGNEAGLDAGDVFAHLVDDPDTDAIGVFLESVRRPEVFRRAALRAAAAGKPVVALHAGRSELGRAAAQSHTGALVGNHGMALAALADLGVVTVDSLEGLVCTVSLLSQQRQGLRGRRLAVVAASGGACELIADAADSRGLTLPPFRPALAAGLNEVMPEFADVHNPLDVTGFVVKQADLPFVATQLVAELAADDYDAVILQSVVLPAEAGPDSDAVEARFARLADAIDSCPIPVVLQTAATYSLGDFALGIVRRHDLVVLPGIEAGIAALEAAARRHELLARALRPRDQDTPPVDPAPATTAAVKSIAVTAGLPFPPERCVTTADDAVRAAGAIGYPVVLKVNSPDIAHKTEVGGVALGLDGPDQVRAAFDRMLTAVRTACPAAYLAGVDVVAMRSPGTELLVAVTRDPDWGPMLTIGAGGILAELLQDTVTRPLPLRTCDIGEMLDEVRIGALLRGFRGGPAADRAAVCDAVAAIALTFRQAGPTIRSLEVNPLRVDGPDVQALDLLAEFESGGGER